MKKLKTICIIPARGGSKGIKLKNLRSLNGKPLIYYPIKAALNSRACDKVIVSTDHKKIAKVSKKYGAEVPFLRQKKYSKDLVTTETTLKNALKQAENYYNIKFDICVFLTCTNLFRKTSWIKYAVNFLKKNKKYDSVFSVHHLYRHFWHYKNNKPEKVLPWMKNYTSRQIAPKLFQEQTGIICATRSHFWREGKRIGKKNHFIINENPITCIDINSEIDLIIANSVMRYLKKNKIKYF